MRQHRRGEYRHRWTGQSIWTYPKNVVGPGSTRDLIALGQGALVYRSWAFLGTYPKEDLHVVPPSSATGSQPPVYTIPLVSHGCRWTSRVQWCTFYKGSG